jgi:hypothetical protein
MYMAFLNFYYKKKTVDFLGTYIKNCNKSCFLTFDFHITMSWCGGVFMIHTMLKRAFPRSKSTILLSIWCKLYNHILTFHCFCILLLLCDNSFWYGYYTIAVKMVHNTMKPVRKLLRS